MAETLHKTFQRRIRERRDVLELTQRDAARLTGLGQTYISGLETGANQPPAFEVLARMARIYRTTADYLLGLSDDMAGTAGVISSDAERMLNIFERLSPLAQEIALGQLQALREVDERRRQRLQGVLPDGDGSRDGHQDGDGQGRLDADLMNAMLSDDGSR